MVEATIEGLAITPVLRGNLTLSDGYAVLSTTLPWIGDTGRQGNIGERNIDRYLGAEFRAAEKCGWGMVLKILARARPFLKVDNRSYGITKTRMLPLKGMLPFVIHVPFVSTNIKMSSELAIDKKIRSI